MISSIKYDTLIGMIKVLLKPILELTLLSTLFSLIFSNDYISFAKYFFVFSVAQLIIYNIYKAILFVIAERIKNERIKEYSKQGMEISCPCYMEKKMLLPLELNGLNTFNCIECKKDFTVDITARAFLQTETIDLEKADAAFVEAYNKIQNLK